MKVVRPPYRATPSNWIEGGLATPKPFILSG
jgi:hypothetical protein